MAPTPTAGPAKAAGKTMESQEKAKGFHMPGPPSYDSLEEERQSRKERLAASFRIFANLGFDEGVAGHLTYRDPILKDHFWVNPFGLSFRYVTASDLLLIGPDGEIKDGGKPERRFYNQAAFAIHHAIHTARPDMDAACHSHSINGKAFSTLGQNIKITTQDSCGLYNRCSLYENFGGVVLADEEGDNIAKSLGPQNIAMIMQNHGILTCGTTIEAAVFRFIVLERHCEVMLKSMAAGNPIEIGDEEAEFTRRQTGSEQGTYFQASPYYQQVEFETKGSYKD